MKMSTGQPDHVPYVKDSSDVRGNINTGIPTAAATVPVPPAAAAGARMGVTDLHAAAKAGELAEAQAFLEDNKSKINETDSTGWTALHWACSRGKEDMVKLLLDNGATVNVVTEDNWAPAHDAARAGSEPVLKLLKEAGAQMDVKTKNGSTMLHFAAQYDRVDVVKYLLTLEETEKDYQNQAGHSALHVAARHGKENVAKALIEERANVLLKDKIQRNAQKLAEEHGFHALGAILEEEAVNQEMQSMNNAEIAMKDAEEAIAMAEKAKAATALETAVFLYNLCSETDKAKAAEEKLAKVRTTLK